MELNHLKPRFAIFAILSIMATHIPCLSQERSANTKANVPKQTAPWSFERLKKAVEDVRKRILPEQSVIRLIQERGLAFRPTSEELQKLKIAGASAKLLDAIEIARKPEPEPVKQVPPPPPPPPKEGLLAISCAPVDCSVFVGSQPRGPTKKGRLERIKETEGTTLVSVQAEGYEAEPNEIKCEIKANDTIQLAFKLIPTRDTLERGGAEAFEKMVEALGGEQGLKETGFMRAIGTAHVYDREGKPVPWSLTTLIKMPDKTKFNVARGGQRYEIANVGDGYQWSKSPKGPEFQDLEDGLRLVREYQIATVMERLADKHHKAVATKMPVVAGEDVEVRLEGSPDSYLVMLDSDSRPKEIKLESTGLNSGLRILFSDYVGQGKGFYPKVTQVILPVTPRRGIEARYDKVELNPSGVTDSDFLVKKGARLGGR